MIRRHFAVAVPAIAVAASALVLGAQEAPVDRLRSDVEYLTAPDLEGRLTGTPGAEAAAAYLAKRLTEIGAVPLEGSDSLLQPFDFVAGARDQGSSLARDEMSFAGPEKVAALSFSESGQVTAPVVFAGYGLKIPDGQDYPYDSYAGLDVDGKIVLVLRYFPEDAAPEAKRIMARYSGLRYKALQAREAGAVGMLVVAGPSSPNAGKTVTDSTDAAIQGSGIVAATVAGEVGEWLFEGSNIDLKQAQTTLDSGDPHVAGFTLEGGAVTLSTRVERVKRVGRNVVGVLPATAATTYPGAIVLGAHFDHLGAGDNAGSLAGADERHAVHAGADDNASGVAAVLALGRRWTEQARTRDLILAFWTGEELGLLGSQAFVDGLEDAESAGETPVIAYLNFDMVGRLREHRMTLQAVGSSPAWSGWIEAANVPVGLSLTLQEDPYLPTDSTAFHNAGVPSLNFFTGSHEDYHRPSDLPATLNYEGINTVVELAFGVTRRLMAAETPPEFVQVERSHAGPGARDGVRAYTGTIPDYASETQGLRLSGVMAGGPAEVAGLQAGDVIVEFGGQEIRNIYDYTYALDAIEIGEETPIVFERNGERLEVTIVPTARE